ncbi:MAG TPA: LysR family transcriptional regulator [Caldimonas sp.]|jgi:DNA-binding transcriptional LysR family regulator|nr:LysR family transcriptional regulator [Caldimonas sp.]HEX2542111.1 LysR family transcriptional regulator [Caldimonas sp.]
MNLRFVEAFYWVVTLRSMTRAAEKLHLTQSAMSSRVASLEEELGTLLLDRRDRQFRVTGAGARFFLHAEKLLALQRDIKAEMGSSGSQPVTLRIGAIESVVHSWLIDWLRDMRTQEPGLALELTVETSPILVDQLRRGTLDLAVAALPASGGELRSQALPAMEMAFAGHAGLHRRRRYALDELVAAGLLTFQRGSQPQLALLDLLRRAGLEQARVHSISSISAMAELVEEGLGVATLPRAVVSRLARRLPLKALLVDTALPALPIHLSWRLDPTSLAQQALIDSVCQRLGVGRPASKKSMR